MGGGCYEIQDWILGIMDDQYKDAARPRNAKWRNVDLILAKEISKTLRESGGEFGPIKRRIASTRRQCFREGRVMGGREMLRCIFECDNPYIYSFNRNQ